LKKTAEFALCRLNIPRNTIISSQATGY